MLVRDLRTGRLVMLDPTKLSGLPRGHVNGMGQWAGDERLGLPFLAALPALAAKVLPLVSSLLPMLTGGGGKSEPPPAPPPPSPAPPPSPFATATSFQPPSAIASLLPMPLAQTGPMPEPFPATPAPMMRVTSAADTEVVMAPMRVRQPDGSTAVVPMRVRRKRRRRRVRLVRTNSQSWPPSGYAMPVLPRSLF